MAARLAFPKGKFLWGKGNENKHNCTGRPGGQDLSGAGGGGIDRSDLNFGILYEDGNYVELGYSRVTPTVSGTYSAAFGPFSGSSTGDLAGDYSAFSLGYKHQFTDRLALTLILNTPYGADAHYTAGPYTGLTAQWKSRQIAAVLKYDLTDNFSAHGGLKYLRSSAQIGIPNALFPGGYTAVGDTDERVGYIVGAAYEKPEIALRVALTYESGITHSFRTTETAPAFGPGNPIASTTDVEMPQSLLLDFQTGVARNTLLFGTLRWSEWSVWEVRPIGFEAASAGNNIADFDDDVFTWTLGVGRKLNETLSVFARVGYEKKNRGISSRFAPTDGYTSAGIGGSWTKDNLKIAGGIEYISVGDATDSSGVVFKANDAVGVGLSVGMQF